MEIETLLHKEIKSNLELLEETSRDSDEYKQLVDVTTKLVDRAIDMEKIHAETEAKEKSRELERELKLKQIEEETKIKLKQIEEDHEFKLKQLEEAGCARAVDYDLKKTQADEDRKGRIWRDAISIAGIVVPTWLTIWGTKKSFEFEKEGTITTIMGRGFIGKLLHKK